MLVLMSLIKQYKELLHLNAHNLPASLFIINTSFISVCLSLSFTHSLRSKRRLFVPFSLNSLRSSCSFYFCCKWSTKLVRRNWKGIAHYNAVKLFITAWYSLSFHFNKISLLIENTQSFIQSPSLKLFSFRNAFFSIIIAPKMTTNF